MIPQQFDFIFKGIHYQGIVIIERTFNATNDYVASIIQYKWNHIRKEDSSQPLSKWNIQTYLSNLAQKTIV